MLMFKRISGPIFKLTCVKITSVNVAFPFEQLLSLIAKSNSSCSHLCLAGLFGVPPLVFSECMALHVA